MNDQKEIGYELIKMIRTCFLLGIQVPFQENESQTLIHFLPVFAVILICRIKNSLKIYPTSITYIVFEVLFLNNSVCPSP